MNRSDMPSGRAYAAFCLGAGLFAALLLSAASAAGVSRPRPVAITGDLFAETDISAIERVGEWFFLAADEGHVLQRAGGMSDAGLHLQGSYSLKDGKPVKRASRGSEFDIEAMAFHQGRLYVGFRGPVLRDNWVAWVYAA